jgi:hypothetical protein
LKSGLEIRRRGAIHRARLLLVISTKQKSTRSSFQRKLDCEGMDAKANVRAANGPKGKRQDCRASSSFSLLFRRKALQAKAGFQLSLE